MHSADYAVARCLSFCLSVCHTPVRKTFYRQVGTPLWFSVPNGASNARWNENIAIFDQYLAISQKRYKTRSVTMECKSMLPFSVILSDRLPRFQGHDIIILTSAGLILLILACAWGIDPSAAEFRRRSQPAPCRAAAAGKKSARRHASRNLLTPPPP